MEKKKVSVCELKEADEVDDGIDRISALPDSVLCHILSYLPTKYAIATSILSTRGKNIFPSILNEVDIDFDDSLTMDIDFADFIFTCKTLEVLVLVGGWQLKSPPLVELPRLRMLQLANEPLVYNQSIPSSIWNGFVGLEELVLNSLMIHDLMLDLSLPKLRRLEIKECNNNYGSSFGIILDAPALKRYGFNT
ncbi:hypothetical protein LIER_39511 [Lithospermum erythrorhizon]|uniref:F-box domain-containing protein n=1 Tax=Lithospermum erythrorhizon TaxID=34254 RepID=A0AAV3QK20_LITER